MTTLEEYDRRFADEAALWYPALDAFEAAAGFAIDRTRLERAARVLACPVKVNPPCWQHGRLLYATLRRYLEWWEQEQPLPRMGVNHTPKCILDIGTAKGFSALMMQYAVFDSVYAVASFPVFSLDVVDPKERVRRNTVAEVDGLLTLEETLIGWADVAQNIEFIKSSGRAWLHRYSGRVCFAFIDGKHNYQEVSTELGLLASLQRKGDVVILDDLQIDGVRLALSEYRHAYEWQTIEAKPENSEDRAPRIYAVARRR